MKIPSQRGYIDPSACAAIPSEAMGSFDRLLRYRFGVGLVGVALGLAGCSKGPQGPGIKFQLAENARAGGCRKTTGEGMPYKPLLRDGTLRLSVLRRDQDTRTLHCDLVAEVPAEKPNIDLGSVDRTRLDLFAELFDKTGNRIYSGAALSNASTGMDGQPQVVTLFPVADWGCPAGAPVTARAFHSATMLPSGEVLMLGGIAAVSGNGPDVFGVLASPEVYDPRKGVFTALTGAAAVKARAFHQAAVVSATDTQVRILVYGGLTATANQAVLLSADKPTLFRLAPTGNAEPAGAELLTYDVANRTLTTEAVDTGTHKTGFAGGTALPGGGLLVMGGGSFVPSGTVSRSNPIDLTKNTELVVGTLAQGQSMPTLSYSAMTAKLPWYLGSTVTPLSSSTAMVLGARLPQMMGDVLDAGAVMLKGLPAAPAAVADPGVKVSGAATVFHTATRLGLPIGANTGATEAQVLVTGGFEVVAQPPQKLTQPPSGATAVRLYTVSDPEGTPSIKSYAAIPPYQARVTCGADDGHYRPAGFEAATATALGRQVLITGGSPTVDSTTPCIDCEPGDGNLGSVLCVLRQAVMYDADTQKFSAVNSMQIGRFGHRQTLLPDGNVLVSGGLVRNGAVTEATAEAEIYNPRTVDSTKPDLSDPIGQYLTAEQVTARGGKGLAAACSVLK